MYEFQIVTLRPDSPKFGVGVKLLQAYSNFKETYVRNVLGDKLTPLLEKIVEIKTSLVGCLLFSEDPSQPDIPDDVRTALQNLKSVEAEFEKEAEEPWTTTLKSAVKHFEINFPTLIDSMLVDVQQTLRDATNVTD